MRDGISVTRPGQGGAERPASPRREPRASGTVLETVPLALGLRRGLAENDYHLPTTGVSLASPNVNTRSAASKPRLPLLSSDQMPCPLPSLRNTATLSRPSPFQSPTTTRSDASPNVNTVSPAPTARSPL